MVINHWLITSNNERSCIMTRDDFDIALTDCFSDDWVDQKPSDKDKLFTTVMEVWLLLELTEPNEECEEALANFYQISQMDEKMRLRYRTMLAEAGVEYTPDQVEMLGYAIEYAFEAFDEHME